MFRSSFYMYSVSVIAAIITNLSPQSFHLTEGHSTQWLQLSHDRILEYIIIIIAKSISRQRIGDDWFYHRSVQRIADHLDLADQKRALRCSTWADLKGAVIIYGYQVAVKFSDFSTLIFCPCATSAHWKFALPPRSLGKKILHPPNRIS